MTSAIIDLIIGMCQYTIWQNRNNIIFNNTMNKNYNPLTQLNINLKILNNSIQLHSKTYLDKNSKYYNTIKHKQLFYATITLNKIFKTSTDGVSLKNDKKSITYKQPQHNYTPFDKTMTRLKENYQKINLFNTSLNSLDLAQAIK